MANVKSTPLRLKLSDKARSDIQAFAAQIIAEMNRAGVSSSGAPFPEGKTKNPITMDDSGRMHRDFNAFTTRVNWNAPYAQVTNAIWKWAGLPPSGVWREKFEKGVQAILNKELTQE